jgi:hypothetical protein
MQVPVRTLCWGSWRWPSWTAVFASPARFAVDGTADAVDSQPGDGSCRTVAGACTLRAAIQEGNALPGGTYALIDNHVGGAVHIRDSQLSDNFAREGGSAINNNHDGTVTITGTTVSGDSY